MPEVATLGGTSAKAPPGEAPSAGAAKKPASGSAAASAPTPRRPGQAARRPGKRQPRAGAGWLGGVTCGVLVAAAPAAAILLAGTLLPGLVASLCLAERPRRTAQAMLLFGLAMCCHRLRDLWLSGGTLAAAWELLADPLPLAIAWFAAAFGWALTELLPLAVGAGLEVEARRQSLGLRRARRRAADGWDLGSDT